MAGENTHHQPPPVTLQDAIAEIGRLQTKMASVERGKTDKEIGNEEDEIIDSQPLAQALWDVRVPENFKTPHLPVFDGKSDPSEHLMAVGTQTAIIGAA
ncbi:hypothetical protein A2U01_0037630, partial [Trifolium medium]|nr:hypothetical protein [Trifolium medium]